MVFVKKKGSVKVLFANSKGSELDLLPLMITLLMFGIAILIGWVLLNNSQLLIALSSTPDSALIMNRSVSQYPIFDTLFFAALIGLSLTSILAATLVRQTPLFFVISLILLSIILIVGAVVSNFFHEMSSAAIFSGASSVFPKMFFIMDNLVMYLLIEGALIILALYSTRGA